MLLPHVEHFRFGEPYAGHTQITQPPSLTVFVRWKNKKILFVNSLQISAVQGLKSNHAGIICVQCDCMLESRVF